MIPRSRERRWPLCAYAIDRGRQGPRAAVKDVIVHVLLPLARLYIRYVPIQAGKRRFWRHVLGPHFAWHAHTYLARTRFGARLRGNTYDLLQQYVYFFGIWEPHLTSFLIDRVRPGDVVVDVGANIGYFSVLTSKLVGDTGRVIALEASPSIFQRLDENLRLNRISNVSAMNIAVAADEGTRSVYLGPAHNIGLTTTVANSSLRLEAAVASKTLVSLLPSDIWRAVRILKIDVEGGEADVIAGLAPLLPTAPPELEVVVEISPETLAQSGLTPEDVMRPFEAAGFRAYRIENDYSPLTYLDLPKRFRVSPLQSPIESQVDVVFSRQDLLEVR